MTGTLTARLIRTLDELVALLDEEQDTHWAARMRKASRELKASDYHGVERLLAAYGGMGSFNDFVPRRAEHKSRISELSSEAHDLATEIRRRQ